MDLYQGTCHEFGKVFSEDLASFQEIDDKIQHHADALTNCLKLVLSNPDSPSVQTLWMWLIRSSVKFLLWIDSRPSTTCLKLFVEKIRPWLIDQNFTGLCCKELTDMYNLAVKGPWSHPALKKLLDGDEVSLKELHGVFAEDLECVEFHMASLLFAGKTNEFILFAKAAIVHPQVQNNKVVQKVYQEHISDILKEEDLICRIKDFDLGITVSLLKDSMKAGRKCENLCNAAVKYLLKNKEMKWFEEILSCWIKLILSKHQNTALFDKIQKNFLESDATVISVQQCVVLARVLWKVVGNKSRMMCVEILCRALQLLSSDEQDSDELKKGILSSIAYFLPNSQVARSCILTLFIINPTVDHYFELAKTYKIPYDRDKDLANDFKAHLRLTLLEYLQQQWPQPFLQSSSWDWPLLRNVCYNMLSNDDLAVVRLEEREEESRQAAPQPPVEGDETSLITEIFHFEEVPSDSKCSVESDKETSEANTSGSVDICDCVACKIKQKKGSAKDQGALVHSPVGKKHHTSKLTPPTPQGCARKSSHKKDHSESEETITCPEEKCQRALKSKTGMTKHLSKTHRWTISEIHGYYLSIEPIKPNAKSNSKHLRGNSNESNKKDKVKSPNEQSSDLSSESETATTSVNSEISAEKSVFPIDLDVPPEQPSANSMSLPEPVDPQKKTVDRPHTDVIKDALFVAEAPIGKTTEPPISSPLDAAPNSDENITETFDTENTPPETVQEICGMLETSQSPPSGTSQSNFMTQQSCLPSLTSETETLTPIFVKETLNPIFVTENNPEPQEMSDTVEEQQKDGEFACPAKNCDRVYKHRHTVQEHLEFRHKYSPDEAAKMALSAPYICLSSIPPPPPKSQSTDTDIRHARGWYWPVDEFLGKEITERHFRLNQVVDSNFRFSLECDIIYTLGRAPLSYSSVKAAAEIVSDWKFAEKYREKEEGEKTPPPEERKVPSKSLAEKMQSATISTVSVSQKQVQKAVVVSNHKHTGANTKTALPKAKKLQNEGLASFPSHETDAISSSINSGSAADSGKKDVSCQTSWKSFEKFHKADHFHNLSEVQNRRLKRTKKTEYPIAITILAGSFVCRETRTLASQCCQSEAKQTALSAAIPKKKPAAVKRKGSSTDAFSKPFFSSTAEVFNPPAPKQVKRKYDVQTVYHLADKYSDMKADPVDNSAALAANNSKPSFADALNSVNLPPVPAPEKPKAKRKPSKSIELVKVEDLPAFQKPRVAASITSSSRSSDVSDGSSSKKTKPKKSKVRSLSSSTIKKYSVSADVVVKKRVDDLSRQLFPSHDYEELLKQAEQLSSSVKSKPAVKPQKTAVNPASRPTLPTPVTPNLSKPPVPKSAVVDSSNSSINNNNRPPSIVTSTPVPVPEEDVTKKKTQKNVAGKRRIDLRKLSNINKQTKEITVPLDGGNSSHDENSVSEQDSTSSYSSYHPDNTAVDEPMTIAEAFEKDDLMAASQSASADVVCPECSKSMSSAFALTCHMRRRHKVRSKKMFFPGQSVDASNNSSSSSSKSTTPKNAQEPPEGIEASSCAATFGLARNPTNASIESIFDNEAVTYSPCYSADVSELSEDYISDHCHCSDSDVKVMVPINKFVNMAVRPKPVSDEIGPTVYEVLEKLVDDVVCSEILSSPCTTLLDIADGTIQSENSPSQVRCNSCNTSPCSSIVRSASEHASAIGQKQVASLKKTCKVSENIDRTESITPSPENKGVKPRVEQPLLSTPYVVYEDWLFKCKMPDCSSKCKRYKSIRGHFRLKHRFEYYQVHPPSAPRRANQTASSSKTQNKTSLREDETQSEITQKDPPARRSAYNEASLQIQLSSIHVSPRRWSQHLELMRLYNKRVRRKVAQALSPAQRAKNKLYRGKLYKKRKRNVSDVSTDSFDADYEAQLPCWYCDASFHCRKNLSLHIRHHILNIDLCEHRCDHPGCLYGFRTEEELENHKKAHNNGHRHLCLFCPNHSRHFKSFRKLVIHEHVAHSNIKTDLLRVRKNFCLKPVRNWGKPWKLSEIDMEGSDEEESFLAEGHRRTSNKPSVAGSCDHNVINLVLSDVLETIVEYEALHGNKTTKPAIVQTNSEVSNATDEQDQITVKKPVDISVGKQKLDKVGVVDRVKISDANEITEEIVSTDTEIDQIEGVSDNYFYLQHCDNDSAELNVPNDSEKQSFGLDESTAVADPNVEPKIDNNATFSKSVSMENSLNDSSAIENSEKENPLSVEKSVRLENDAASSVDVALVNPVADVFSPPRLPEIAGFDYDTALDVIHTVHKIVCDIEIEEQANYMRLCGFVPTGVMYYKQCDLLNSPGVGLSVYGYNSEAFMALDMASNAKSYLPPTTSESSGSSCAVSTTPNDAPQCSKDLLGPSSSSVPSSSCDSEDHGSILDQGKSGTSLVDNMLLPPGLPGFDSADPFAPLSQFPLLLQAKLTSLYLNRDYHPMWRLDADEARSDICDITAFDCVSKLLFCQHYVVPSRSLDLPRPPLRGICTVYPVTSDLPRYTAFTSSLLVPELPLCLEQDVNVHNTVIQEPSSPDKTSPISEVHCANNPSLEHSEPSSQCSVPHYPDCVADSRSENQMDVNTGNDKIVAGNECDANLDSFDDNVQRKVVDTGNDVDSGNDVVGKSGNEENIDPTLIADSVECYLNTSNDNVAVQSPNFDFQNSTESQYFDRFMDEVRRGTATNKKKSALLKPANIFSMRGRPRKSCGVIGKKSSLRRSMSEIVAFCDTPNVIEELVRTQKNPKPPKKKTRTDKKLTNDLNLPTTPAMNLIPVVEISPISVSPLKLSKFKKIKEIKSKLLKQRVKITNLKKAKQKREKNEANRKKTFRTRRKPDSDSKKSKLFVTESAKSSEDSVEEEIGIAERATSSVEVSDPEGNLPVNTLEQRRLAVLFDHSYALVSSLPSTNVAEECMVSNQIEISDSCQESPTKQATAENEEATESCQCIPGSFHSFSLESEPTINSTSTAQSLAGAADLTAPSQAGEVVEIHKKTESEKNYLTDGIPNAVPCIFCSSWFDTIPLCKQHFKDVHANELVRYKKQSKSVLSSRKRNLLLSAANSAKKRLAKSNALKQQRAARRSLNKRPAKPVKILPSNLSRDTVVVRNLLSSREVSQIHSQNVIGHSMNDVVCSCDVVQHLSPAVPSTLQAAVTSAGVTYGAKQLSSCTGSLPFESPTCQNYVSTRNDAATDMAEAGSKIFSTAAVNVPGSADISPRSLSAMTSPCMVTMVQTQPALITPAVNIRPLQKKTCAVVAPTFHYSNSPFSTIGTFQRSQNRSGDGVSLSPLPDIDAALVSVNVSPPVMSSSQRGTYAPPSQERSVTRIKLPATGRPVLVSQRPVAGGSPPIRCATSVPASSFQLSSSARKRNSAGSPMLNALQASISKLSPVNFPLSATKFSANNTFCLATATPASRTVPVSSERVTLNYNTASTSGCSSINVSNSVPQTSSSVSENLENCTAEQCDLVNTDSSESLENTPRRSVIVSISDETEAKRQRIKSTDDYFGEQTHQDAQLNPAEDFPQLKQNAETSSKNFHKSKSAPLYCPYCTSVYPDTYHYKRHMLSVHSLYICTIDCCYEMFSSENALDDHTMTQHRQPTAGHAAVSIENAAYSIEFLFYAKRRPNLSEAEVDKALSAVDPQEESHPKPKSNNKCNETENSTNTKSSSKQIVDTNAVWNSEISLEKSKEMHEKLLEDMTCLSKEEFLRLVLFEVRTFAKRCHILTHKDGGRRYMRCPISSCCVLGDDRQRIYDHVIKDHQLGPIMRWVRKRDLLNRQRNIRHAAMKSKQKDDDALSSQHNGSTTTSSRSTVDDVSSHQNTADPSTNDEISSTENIMTTSSTALDQSVAADQSRDKTKESACAETAVDETNEVNISVPKADQNFKCRFSECGKTIGGESNFRSHMLSHSPSRIAWHKEMGKLWPLFNPVVVVSRNNRSTSLARAQCETESETLDGASESITTCPTPLNSSADPASDDKCSKCPNPVNSSPRKPLVMLKKLSSFN